MNGNNNGMSRERLMQKLQMYSFAVYDALLYLDAYPDSAEALEFYNRNKRLEQEAMNEYERRFGKISLSCQEDSWQWTDGPWPWQNEEVR